MRDKKIVLLGAGNIATHLAPALLKAGLNLCQIYSRTPEAARELGKKTGISFTSEMADIYPDCDIYIFCVSDDVLPSFFKSIRIHPDASLLHTSGSVSMEVFRSHAGHYGVLYPLQTFTKKRDLDFHEIPLCIEAVDAATLKDIRKLAEELSGRVVEISSEKRKILHLAAVFANNFVNHLYGIAGKILEKEQLEFDLLRPLIFETAHKILLMPPEQAQTGPARRGDEGILNMHKALLKGDCKLSELYTMLSDSIRESVPKSAEQKHEEGQPPLTLSLW